MIPACSRHNTCGPWVTTKIGTFQGDFYKKKSSTSSLSDLLGSVIKTCVWGTSHGRLYNNA